jgi:type I restriction-modification system DNA methylase subunit
MKEFIEFLENHKIISQLKKQYLKDSNSDENFRFFNNFKKLLSQSSKKRNTNLDGLAYLYEQEVSYHQRKKLGEIYTPRAIVDQILDGVGFYNENCIGSKTIIDISCGAGSFLVQAVKRIINYKRDSSEDLDITGLKNIVQLIKSKIIGIDINPIACILCQINILYELFEIIDSILKEDPSFPIPVFIIENKNIFSQNFNQKYDLIVGNPPYLFIRDITQEQKELIEKRQFETCRGQYDYYQLFIEIGINLLKPNGCLGFIVPDSILALSNRHILRKFIYDHTIIKEISYLGPQFDDPVVSNIIIILQKEVEQKKRTKNIVNIKLKQNSDDISNSILQSHFENWNYKFLININDVDIKILTHLNKNFPSLKQIKEDSRFNFYIKRGVELTKEGKIVYCPVCKKYSPLPSKKLICKRCKTQLMLQSIENIIVDQKPQDRTTIIFSID